MMLHRITEITSDGLDVALACFEQQFSYPLGAAGDFQISHGKPYLTFFRSIGKPVLLAVEVAGAIVGTLVVVERRLRYPGKACAERAAHYLCDLKVSPAARSGRVLAKLLTGARELILASPTRDCYCIVMDGTGRLPMYYTGRMGIPRFEKLGRILIWRISRDSGTVSDLCGVGGTIASPDGRACFATGGNAALRSQMTPYPIHLPGLLGAGLVEDTRRGKRLWMRAGGELCSAHLSGFSFGTPEAGAAVIRRAVQRAEEESLPALFVAVPEGAAGLLEGHLVGLSVQVSPATVFGYGISSGLSWWVDTAEI